MKKALPVLALATFLLAACGHAPIYNVTSHPVPSSARSMTLDQMEKVIVDAGQSRGWRFQRVSAGKLRGHQEQPKYAADVEVMFDQSSYAISYVGSRGLEQQGGTIHKHYNFWIRNLEADIDTWLSNASLRTN